MPVRVVLVGRTLAEWLVLARWLAERLAPAGPAPSRRLADQWCAQNDKHAGWAGLANASALAGARFIPSHAQSRMNPRSPSGLTAGPRVQLAGSASISPRLSFCANHALTRIPDTAAKRRIKTPG